MSRKTTSNTIEMNSVMLKFFPLNRSLIKHSVRGSSVPYVPNFKGSYGKLLMLQLSFLPHCGVFVSTGPSSEFTARVVYVHFVSTPFISVLFSPGILKNVTSLVFCPNFLS